MAGLDDAGVDRADRDLVQAMAAHRQEFVIGRVPARRRSSRTKRSAKAPLAMIEPRAAVGRVRRYMTVEVAYGPFKPDCRRVEPAHRPKTSPAPARGKYAPLRPRG